MTINDHGRGDNGSHVRRPDGTGSRQSYYTIQQQSIYDELEERHRDAQLRIEIESCPSW